VCSKAVSRKSHLISHKRLHSGERPLWCDMCCKAFIQKSDMIKHQRIDKGEHPYCCDEWKKTFTLKISQHINGHTVVISHIPEVCVMSFILLTHMITQHMCAGQCTYCCDVCSKAISQQISHIAIQCLHNGELLYYCDVCNKTCCKRSYGKTSTCT